MKIKSLISICLLTSLASCTSTNLNQSLAELESWAKVIEENPQNLLSEKIIPYLSSLETSTPSDDSNLTNESNATTSNEVESKLVSQELILTKGTLLNSPEIQDVEDETCRNNRSCKIDTFSGNGVMGFGGDQEPAIKAQFRNLSYVSIDKQGDIYISDTDNHRIRKINHQSGRVTTVVGTGVPGFSGDNGLALNAEINTPLGIEVDQNNNLYFVDNRNQRIRVVDLNTGVIKTVAGNGSQGYNGDEIEPTLASLNNPQDISVDDNNHVYIADQKNQRVRLVDLNMNLISTIAGSDKEGYAGDSDFAENALFRNPTHLTYHNNKLFVSDTGNHRIRKIDFHNGKISTVIGTGTAGFEGDGGLSTNAKIHTPSGVFVENNILIFADKGNHRVRKVDMNTGKINTIAGIGSSGYSGDDNLALNAELKSPTDVFIGQDGASYIVDAGNQRIRFIKQGNY